ncbi:methionyl-tRNA formyltransferase [Robertkochia solimangrovi]|uniref:methionyl-tRNA formyltransferase n=1 Tax=Robertkochia solimangrovi TaxID=2213046 RepID=UPI0011811610|nr:methionyl-tRNA formyltransferase [Robertkochia solimangrovi]TRZ42868.1 methionyl-tRNA formyltransferase [Robertkochia solimangrovi]
MEHTLRIVFMGTPDFAVATLDRIITSGYEVVGVITAPDRPAGRGRKLNESAVKKYATEKGLTVLQPTNLKDPDFLESLRSLKADVQVVVAFRMLPEAVWKMPKLGTFNLHASLLPDYRGAAPINWAVMNGEATTGVTTFFIDEKIDTGAIIMNAETPIGASESAGELHDRLMEIGADLVVETLDKIETGTITTQKQPESDTLKTAHKIHRDTCKIDWNLPTQEIYNKVRGLSPYPAAWTTLISGSESLDIKIFKTTPEKVAIDQKPGTVITSRDAIKVVTGDGTLNILEMQLPGKRKMSVKDILNGFQPSADAEMR